MSFISSDRRREHLRRPRVWPNGTLFFTEFANSRIGEIESGSTGPDFTASLNSGLSSIGAVNFVPAGYNGAGNLVMGSYTNGAFCTAPLTENGDDAYSIGACSHTTNIGNGGPEGTVYVPQGSPDFSKNTMLVTLYRSGIVAAYQLDANGPPIPETEQDFLTGLGRVQGAVVDPLAGDFLFSTFSGGLAFRARGRVGEAPDRRPSTR